MLKYVVTYSCFLCSGNLNFFVVPTLPFSTLSWHLLKFDIYNLLNFFSFLECLFFTKTILLKILIFDLLHLPGAQLVVGKSWPVPF